MSTQHHTDIAAGAAATAAVLNAPLGQLDAKLTHTAAQYADAAAGNTTVTTASTYYAIASFEVSFTPAYTGQVFLVCVTAGNTFPDTAGHVILNCRITDGASATILDSLVSMRRYHGAAAQAGSYSGLAAWTAGAGDVGATRKAKLYVTHSVNGTIVTCGGKSVTVLAH